ncbi:MAG: hypothetical protein WB762_07150 [Candidatus Sulfotelmatobacter sp.]
MATNLAKWFNEAQSALAPNPSTWRCCGKIFDLESITNNPAGNVLLG